MNSSMRRWGVAICYVELAHANAHDQAITAVCVKNISRRTCFSTVVGFSDSTTVFAQRPMVKHLALSKECFSSSPLKPVLICVP